MDYILCVDNSGSTAGSIKYWDKVQSLYETFKPKWIIYWNTTACEATEFRRHSGGGTRPQCFLELLQNQKSPYNLIITTDGEILHGDMEACRRLPALSFVNSIAIHYIGNDSYMNIGLNMIFAQLQCDTTYSINAIEYQIYREDTKYDELSFDEFMSPNLLVSLTVQVEKILSSFPSPEKERRIADLRAQLNKLFSKFEFDTLSSADNLHELYKANDTKKFMNLLRADQCNVQNVNSRKCTILNVFDGKHSLNISRIMTASVVAEPMDIDVSPEIHEDWQQFEDSITLDQFNLPCLLFKESQIPIITDDDLLKHPFKLLSRPELIEKIMRLIEPNFIDYTTYRKLCENPSSLISPYTRDPCSGVFILEISDAKCIRNNCRSISTIFGSDKRVPGHLNLWNLIILYLLHQYKFECTETRDIILKQIQKFCKTFSTRISLTQQCQIIRQATIDICLWFSIFVSSKECPNSAMNILRSPFGLELLTFYNNVIEPIDPLLMQQTKKWTIWNYLLRNRHRTDLKLEVKAQHQNYCIHKDKIVLLVEKCSEPFKSELNLLDPDSVNTLFNRLTPTSSKFDKIDNFEIIPAETVLDEDSPIDSIYHVKINLNTCWPLVICPITKMHWRECIGDYDVKSESLVRVFNKYCCKYNQYPESFMDLVLYYSRTIGNRPIITANIKCLEYVFDVIFKDLMLTFDCKEYLKIYTEHTDETVRLSKEN